MNIYFIQFLSKTDKVVLGKINNMDLGNFSSFSGGLGLRHFMNNAFVGPPNGITVPYVFGAYYMSNNEKRDLTIALYDSNSRVNKLGFNDLFQDGVTLFVSADLVTNFFGKKGKQGLTAVGSTKEVSNLNDLEDFFPPTGNYIGEKSNRWSVAYFFEQTLFVNPEKKTEDFGVFGQAGLTDGKGSFADLFFLLGVSGNSPIGKRHQDRWGIAYSYVSLTDGLSEFRAPTIPGFFPGIEVNDRESTLEAYYSAQLTPWVSLGINYQLIVPGVTEAFENRNDNVSFLGFRSIVKL
jgi:porin